MMALVGVISTEASSGNSPALAGRQTPLPQILSHRMIGIASAIIIFIPHLTFQH
jgi:hypothetical protein